MSGDAVVAARHEVCRYALSEAQTGLWYAQRLAAAPAAFNTAHALWFDGMLDTARFESAANQMATEATTLALRFAERDDGVPEQWVDPAHVPWLQVVDLSGEADPVQAARAAIDRDRLRPVDPQRDRITLQQLFVLGPHQHVWYLRVHHLATDGYGMALLGERLCALYAGAAEQAALQAWPAVLDEDGAYRQGDRRVTDAAWWRAYMEGAMPSEGGGTPVPAAADALRGVWECDPALFSALHAAAAQIGQPWPDLLTALVAAYCQRMAAQDEVIVGVPTMGRLGSASARVPAMVMNVLPLRTRARDDETVESYLCTAARDLVRARRQGRYRGEQLRRDLGWVGRQHRLHGPLVNVQPFYRPLPWQGAVATLEILGTGPVDEITFGFRGDALHGLQFEIEANPALFDLAMLAAHATRLPHFVSQALRALGEGGCMGEIALATPAEAQHWLHAVNATAHPLEDVSLVALLLAQLKATPGAVALEFEGEQLSYGALEARSRALALQLRALGVGSESRVVVALPRSLALVVALVAVLRAGAAYLPVDLAHPAARMRRVLEISQPVCVLTEAGAAPRFEGLPVLVPTQWSSDTRAALDDSVQPTDAAYVIFTSGSTGEPKGVVVEHRAIVNRLQWMRQHYGFDNQERVLQKTPATFDVSVWEFFLPLLSGGTLVIAPPEVHRDPQALARLIRDARISTVHFVPSMLDAFLAVPESEGLVLRQVFTSGEALEPALRDRFHARVHADLHNLYGPTEAAVDVSWWPASAQDTSQPVPIGYPVWNTRLYVLDAQLHPLPAGVPGDLYLGGVQLARGYLGRDDLTAERFIADPHVPGGRLYRTGDRARWRVDGAVEYLGRSDLQVKLRGLRIELGEIEAVLRDVAAVSRVEVLVRDAALVAYVSATAFDAAALRQQAATQLPDYMVPSAFVLIDHWPVTANGKLDRDALPAPARVTASGRAPATDSERRVAALFEQVLDLPAAVDADADFFRLGGDSLSAVRLLLEIQQHWQHDPGLGTVFQHATVAALAAQLDRPAVDADHGLGPVITLSQGEPGREPLFVIHPAGGMAWNYRELAAALGPARAVYGLQSPALDPTAPMPDSITALAADYAARITQLQPEGPVHLLGWSVGGIIAQAIAVHLHSIGRAVGALVLLDAYPSECWRAEPEPDPVAALRALLAIAGYDPDGHPELDSRERIVAFLRRGDSALGNLPDAVLDGVVRAVTGTNRLIREHHHLHFEGRLTHVRAARDHAQRPHLQPSLWLAHSAQVEALSLPFLHSELTGRDAVAQLAPWLSQHLVPFDTYKDSPA